MHISIHIYLVDTSWNPGKARSNFLKHRIAFEDAEAVLNDPSGLTREDPAHVESADLSPSVAMRLVES